jgi:hypothetical protein
VWSLLRVLHHFCDAVQAALLAQQPDFFSALTAPGAETGAEAGADLVVEHSVLAEQQPDFFSVLTAPGAAFAAVHSVFAEQHSAFFVPTAPGAAVFCELLQPARRATERAARVAMVFIGEDSFQDGPRVTD